MAESVRSGGTYKTLDEQRGALYPVEESFERAPQTIGLLLGPLVFLVIVAGIAVMIELNRLT
jgi:hypothetical protein